MRVLILTAIAAGACTLLSDVNGCLGREGVVLSLQIRAFVKNKEGLAQQELNQSPLPFVESASQPGTAAHSEDCRQGIHCPCHVLSSLLLLRYWGFS